MNANKFFLCSQIWIVTKEHLTLQHFKPCNPDAFRVDKSPCLEHHT